MSIEAMKRALEALELLEQNDNARAMLTDEAIEQAWEIADEAITALRAAIAEAEHIGDATKMVSKTDECTCKASDMPFGRCCKYQPRREWVGLTEEEIDFMATEEFGMPGFRVKAFACAIEAKLKEKNS